MRFLKNKIRLSQEAKNRKLNLKDEHPSSSDKTPPKDASYSSSISSTCKKKEESSQSYLDIKVESENNSRGSPKMISETLNKPLSYNETKNIAINYGRAIVNFAKSPLALPYIEDYISQEKLGLSVSEFARFVIHAKNILTGIESLRSLLLVTDKDDAKTIACKKVFQRISEVFIKFFSVNWIMHGKMTQKMIYLKFRFKILRRIQMPEYFTYLRNTQPFFKKSSVKTSNHLNFQ